MPREATTPPPEEKQRPIAGTIEDGRIVMDVSTSDLDAGGFYFHNVKFTTAALPKVGDLVFYDHEPEVLGAPAIVVNISDPVAFRVSLVVFTKHGAAISQLNVAPNAQRPDTRRWRPRD